MKTYSEVIAHMSTSMWHNHLAGGSSANGLEGYNLVSFIYGISEDKVIEDAKAGFRELNGGLD